MSETKTHWKKTVDRNYLGSYSFEPDEKKVLTIKEAKIGEKVFNPTTNDDELKTVITFKEDAKPMILNSTNMDAIEQAAGTPYIEDWTGTTIKLYVTKVKAFGKVVDAVRIYPKPVSKTKPKLTPDHPKYSSIMKNAQKGEVTLETVKEYFTVPKKLADKIQGLIDEANE